MKTVRDACQLQHNALSIKLSDQIEQLDELIIGEGNGAAFFEKTYITQGMQDLISEGLARLAGASSQAVFHLKQAMGGGKTHLLVGFGLLAKHPGLRKTYCAGMHAASGFTTANIAAFDGRNNPDHFFWGEIANQLGKVDQFKAFWTRGPKAPDEKDWLNLFEGDQPVLILLDEMPPYFHYLDTQKVGNGTVADIATRAFANLLTAANRRRTSASSFLTSQRPMTPVPDSSTAHLKTHAPRWVAKSASSRRSTSRPTRCTTSCASASSNPFPTRQRSAISRMLSAVSWKKPPNLRRPAAAPRRSPTRSPRPTPCFPPSTIGLGPPSE
jgi:hypothetical protein